MTKVAIVVLILECDNCPTGSSWKVALNVSVSSTISSLVIFVAKVMLCGLTGHGPVAPRVAINISLV